MIIHHLQIWRLVTWVLIPQSSLGIFTIIMLLFYWQLGRSLEQIWGTFRFNLYIFGGMFFTIIGSFVYFGLVYAINGFEISNMGLYFSTYYINLSIFLAYSLAIPDMQILLYFIIPIKMKYLAILYAIIVGYSFLSTPSMTERVSIICSLLNFLIFFFSTRNYRKQERRTRGGGGWNPYGGARSARSSGGYGSNRRDPNSWSSGNSGNAGSTGHTGYSETMERRSKGNPPISRHKCAICGRTEATNPEMEFRFCSKCNGNYEYCSEHLFSHTHIE